MAIAYAGTSSRTPAAASAWRPSGPGLYTGRTRHIHVKVQRPRGQVLTTQLYFPGEPDNEGDGIFDEALLMDVSGARAAYDFVLA